MNTPETDHITNDPRTSADSKLARLIVKCRVLETQRDDSRRMIERLKNQLAKALDAVAANYGEHADKAGGNK